MNSAGLGSEKVKFDKTYQTYVYPISQPECENLKNAFNFENAEVWEFWHLVSYERNPLAEIVLGAC